MKYYFIRLEITVGEYQHYDLGVYCTEETDFEKYKNEVAKAHFDEQNFDYLEDGRYYFWGGSQCVEVESVREITKEDFLFLNNYM